MTLVQAFIDRLTGETVKWRIAVVLLLSTKEAKTHIYRKQYSST